MMPVLRVWTLCVTLLCGASAFAAPVFLDGITEAGLRNIRGLNQPTPTYCVPTVGYMMALYSERRGTDLLDFASEADTRLGIQRVADLMKTNQGGQGTDIVKAAEAMQLIYKGVLNGRVFPTYENGWSQLRDNADQDQGNDWSWRDIPARIDQNLPIMLAVSSLNASEVGHAVFAFGYEIVEGGDEVWAYVFDPFADRSGSDTSRQAKKWSINRTTLEIVAAIDVLDGSEHKDIAGTSYVGRVLDSIVTGASTVPEPSTAWLLVAAAGAALGCQRRRTRES